MTSYLQVLTTSSVDSSPCVVLVAPNGSRILVDCGEGTQRACLESNQRLSTLKAICLTSLEISSTGGLPGLMLTAADVLTTISIQQQEQQQQGEGGGQHNKGNRNGNKGTDSGFTDLGKNQNHNSSKQKAKAISKKSNGPEEDVASVPRSQFEWPFFMLPTSGSTKLNGRPALDIIGPRGTRTYLQAFRHFIRRENLGVAVHDDFGSCDDKFHPISPRYQQQQHRREDGQQPKKKKAKHSPSPAAEMMDTRNATFDVSCMTFMEAHDKQVPNKTEASWAKLSYLFTTPLIAGKFLLERATELGVPRGPLYGQLKAGRSVTFQNEAGEQVTVESSQVVEPPHPGVAILVLRYPSSTAKDLSRFLAQVEQQKSMYQSPGKVELEVVVHLATREAYQDASSVAWRDGLLKPSSQEDDNGSSVSNIVQHIWIDTDPSTDKYGTPHKSAAASARLRSRVCPEIYQTPSTPADAPLDSDLPGTVSAYPGLEYQLIPRTKRGFLTKEPSLATAESNNTNNEKKVDDPLLVLSENPGALAKAQSITKESANSRTNAEAGRLIFTGTASAIPCRYRNVSGICLQGADGRCLLLDVGEGTLGQLYRTTTKNDHISVDQINAVWISHPHADHHLGLLRLLHERQGQGPDNMEPLLVVGPRPIFDFLREYCTLHPSLSKAYRGVDCRDFLQGFKPNPNALQRFTQATGMTGIQVVEVQHCAFSYAVLLDGTAFGRVVYSGDCRPSHALAAAGVNADLLIHEATFEVGMEAEALLKRHCTIGEALGIAQQMQAQKVVLTHFSQRYPKIPPLPAHDNNTDTRPIVFAFDFMTLRPDNVVLASQLTPALQDLYPHEIEDDNGDDDELNIVGAASQLAVAALSVPGLFAKSELL